MGRFSDAELEAMRQQLDGHVAEFRAHVEAESLRWGQLIRSQEENGRQILSLARSVESQAEATKGLVDAWQVAIGGMKVLGVIERVAKWLAGVAVFVAIAQWLGWTVGHK